MEVFDRQKRCSFWFMNKIKAAHLKTEKSRPITAQTDPLQKEFLPRVGRRMRKRHKLFTVCLLARMVAYRMLSLVC